MNSFERVKGKISWANSPMRSGDTSFLHDGTDDNKGLAGNMTNPCTVDINDTIILNVGGIHHEVLRSTLESQPGTKFTNRKELELHYRADKREYYFDRNPHIFTSVVNYLRTGELHAPIDVCGSVYRKELKFWGIDDHAIQQCCWIRYCSDLDTKHTLKRFKSKVVPCSFIPVQLSKWDVIRGKAWDFFDKPYSSLAAKIYACVSLMVIMTSITVFCAGSHPGLQQDMTVEHLAEFYDAPKDRFTDDGYYYMYDDDEDRKRRDVDVALQGDGSNEEGNGLDFVDIEETKFGITHDNSIYGTYRKHNVRHDKDLRQINANDVGHYKDNESIDLRNEKDKRKINTIPDNEKMNIDDRHDKDKVKFKDVYDLNIQNVDDKERKDSGPYSAEFTNEPENFMGHNKYRIHFDVKKVREGKDVDQKDDVEEIHFRGRRGTPDDREDDGDMDYSGESEEMTRDDDEHHMAPKGQKTKIDVELSPPHPILYGIDTVCVLFFTLELICRFTFSPSKLRFFISPMNIIDVVALLPFYIELIMNHVDTTEKYQHSAIDVLFLLQVLRILRVFRLIRHVKGLRVLMYTVRYGWREMILMLLFLLIGMLLFGSLIFYTDYSKGQFQSIPHAFWWAIITMTTVGYGDLVPQTSWGYAVGSLCAFTGVLVIAFSVPSLVNNFMLFYSHVQYEKAPRCSKNHTLRQNSTDCKGDKNTEQLITNVKSLKIPVKQLSSIN